MSSSKFYTEFPILQLLIFFSFLTISVLAAPTYVTNQCSNEANYTTNSLYATNLKTLLSSLSSANSTSYNAGFSNATIGATSNEVYGIFLCRGDVDTATCKECVNSSAIDSKQYCPFQKEATIFYDVCMIRYSDAPILGRVDDEVVITLVNTRNIPDNQLSRFEDALDNLMTDTITEAAKSPRRFSVKKTNFTALKLLYSLSQCTPDLSITNCTNCLRQALNHLPTDRIGARVLAGSCNIRYETSSFFNESFITVEPPVLVSSPPPPPAKTKEKGKSSTILIIAIVAPIAVSVVFFVSGCCFIMRRAKKECHIVPQDHEGDEITNPESLQFDFVTIESATNKFSDYNKLGEGGFGQVYKGTLPNGQEIAVKRLSRNSRQGATEFKNEVVLVANLHHRNLVKLLGFCLEQEEKILVYEYVPNKSLDRFLFDDEKRGQLDWSRRYKIIRGVARRILYLHEDSRLKIIHRDLKASNILLDGDMNAKISDFWMARIFGIDQTKGNTSRIVGTYGYMSPEYAMHGHFSAKSDVYSFGVSVLEIISGKKNSSFSQTEGADAEDLLSYAWKLWKDKTPLNLLDSTLVESFSRAEVVRCIHMALLCTQEDPTLRPSMATIVLMLNSFSVTLPYPQEPFFYFQTESGSVPTLKGLDSDQSTDKTSSWKS